MVFFLLPRLSLLSGSRNGLQAMLSGGNLFPQPAGPRTSTLHLGRADRGGREGRGRAGQPQAPGSRLRSPTLQSTYPAPDLPCTPPTLDPGAPSGPLARGKGRGRVGGGALVRLVALGGLHGRVAGLRARWCPGCMAVSRFFCFPILMNFAENKKWPRNPAWRAGG